MEEVCLLSIKHSLEIHSVPVRKFLILFQIYLRYLFGKTPVKGSIASAGCRPFKNFQYLQEYTETLMAESESPRFHQKSSHPVELFYKRNMSADHPIPQVIVVGILRVLLTTCPNAKSGAGSGGVDLHSEWTSCLELLCHAPDAFADTKYKEHLGLSLPELLAAFETRPEFEQEQDRHRLLVAMTISDFFRFLLKHLKQNHIIQFMYLC